MTRLRCAICGRIKRKLTQHGIGPEGKGWRLCDRCTELYAWLFADETKPGWV